MSKVPPVLGNGDYMVECHYLRGEEFGQGFRIYGQIYNISAAGIKILET
jgi:hypothetical protein